MGRDLAPLVGLDSPDDLGFPGRLDVSQRGLVQGFQQQLDEPLAILRCEPAAALRKLADDVDHGAPHRKG